MFEKKYKQVGLKIAYYRKLHGWTQEELAFKASISPSYMSRIERGCCKKGMSLSILLLLAKILLLDAGELICDKDP